MMNNIRNLCGRVEGSPLISIKQLSATTAKRIGVVY
jgi:hypothetical protein